MSRTVIKAGRTREKGPAPLGPTDAVTRGYRGFDLRDIAAQAEAMCAAARIEAQRILEAARLQAAALEDQARREGHAAGHLEGQAQGREAALAEARKRLQTEGASLLTTLTDMVQAFDARKEELYTQARRDVIVLAVAIARRVAGRLAAIESEAPQMAAEACAEALAYIREAAEVTIRVHPADAAAISELTVEWQQFLQGGRRIHLIEDANCERGGVVVETSDSRIDATLSQKMDRIADELVTGWRKRLDDLTVSS